MEIKILCSCGSKYKFDVEPVDGRAPTELACPKCSSNWTETANAIIAQSLGTAPLAVATAPSVPDAHRAAGPVRVALPAKPGIRLSNQQQAPAEPEAPAESGEEAAPGASVPSKKRFRPKIATVDVLKEDGPDWGKFWLGVGGALIGAVIGALLYYFLFIAGIRSKLVALAVAAAAGGCARLIGRKGSNELGLLTAIFSLLAILAAQYFAARVWFFEEDERFAKEYFEEMVVESKEVVAAIPNGTDDEIRAYLVKWQSDDDDVIDPATITPEEIQSYREEYLTTYQRLAKQELTFEQWRKEFLDDEPDPGDEETSEEDERTFKFYFVLLVLSKFNLACLAGAAGLAYKMTDI